mmetsp:Transcript_592/g.1591  ORF Transcript_592/g.1591 Transcript_592/m.1591 type:complete len:458 (+) Transcript_592:194-1567(+)
MPLGRRPPCAAAFTGSGNCRGHEVCARPTMAQTPISVVCSVCTCTHRPQFAAPLVASALLAGLTVNQASLSEGLCLHGLHLGVALGADRVEAIALLHGRVSLVVEAGLDILEGHEEHVALVQAHLHDARGRSRELADGAECGACGGVEPAAIVDLVAHVLRQVLEEVRGAAVQHRLVEVGEGFAEELHARRLVHAPALGADDAVLERVGDAHTIAATDGVCLLDGIDRLELLTIDGHAAALNKLDGNLLHLVRRVLGPAAHLGVDDGHGRLDGLEVLRFVREAREVGISGVLLLWTDEGLNVEGLEVGGHLRAAGKLLEKEGVTPRRVHLHARGEHVGVALEAHLVVSAARSAMREHSHLLLEHRLHEALARHEPANARGIPVSAIVRGLGLDDVEAPVSHLVLQVDDDRVHAARGHALLHVLDVRLIGLAQIRGEGEDLAPSLYEALGHGLGVETT